MRIKYEVTLDDLIAFNLYVHKKSPTLRRARLTAIVGLAVVMLGLSWIGYEVSGQMEVVWFGILWTLVFSAIYPFLWQRNVRRMTARLYGEGSNAGLLGSHVAELRENGLFDGTSHSERLVYWKGIERIESARGQTFVFLSALSAQVIAESGVVEGDYRLFVDELQQRWQGRLSDV